MKGGPRPNGPLWRTIDWFARVSGYPELTDDIRDGYVARVEAAGRSRALLWLVRQAVGAGRLAVRGLLLGFGTAGLSTRKTLRRLFRRPALSVPFAVVLGGGLAASAFMAEVRDALLHPQLGVEGDVRLVTAVDSAGDSRAMFDVDPRRPWTEPSPRAAGRLVTSLFTGGVAQTSVGLLRVRYEVITPGYVTGLGGSLFMGRDVAGPGEAVLSHAFWRAQWRDAPAVLGEVIDVDGHRLELVGVAERSFDGSTCCVRPHFWAAPVEVPAGPRRILAVGVQDSAAAALRLAERLDEAGMGVRRVDLHRALAAAFGGEDGFVGRSLTTLFWLALATLLASILNGSNLLVADALDRRGELSVRRSIGAGPLTLAGLVAQQAAWLAAAGAAVGLGLAWAMTSIAPLLLPIIEPDSVLDLEMGGRGLMVVLLGAAVAAGICALPALAVALAARPSARKRGPSLSGVLVSAQASLGVVLVVLTGLLLAESRRLDGDFVGFRHPGVGVFPVRMASADGAGGHEPILAAGRSVAGGSLAALTTRMPVYGAAADSATATTGDRFGVHVEETTPGFFDVLGLGLTAGRAPRNGQEVAVSADLLRRLGGAPLGSTLTVGEDPLTIVGVTEAATWGTGMPRPTIYRGWSAERVESALLLLRTPGGGAPPLQAVMSSITPLGYAVSWFGSVRDLIVPLLPRAHRIPATARQPVRGALPSGRDHRRLCPLHPLGSVPGTGSWGSATRWVRARLASVAPCTGRAAPGLLGGMAAGTAGAWYVGRSAAMVLGMSPPEPDLLLGGAVVGGGDPRCSLW